MSKTFVQQRPAAGIRPGGPLDWEFVLVLRPGAGGTELRKVPVPEADLTDLLAEFWREGFLRRGLPSVALADLEVGLEPVLEKERCLGLRLEAEDGRGEAVRREYPLEVFRDSA